MTQYTLLFPGQGSQYVGMGKSFFDQDFGRKLLAQAEDILALPLKRLMLEGPQAELTQTAVAQPAILLHSYAAFLYYVDNYQHAPSAVLGHSLGEYSALVAAGVLSFEDALLTVRKRGLFMQEAVSVDSGAMAAVLGLDVDSISRVLEDFCDETQANYAAVANYNGPAQTVIAGTKLGIKQASERLKQAGAKRVLELDVSAPFHCALMKSVKIKMAGVLDKINFQDAQVPVISNVSAQPETNKEIIKNLLLEQIANPVRFTDCVNTILAHKLMGAGFIELGPKNILSGIVRKINPEFFIAHIDSVEDRI